MKETIEFLKDAQTYYLGTINNGKPDVRPFGTAHIFEDKLYFQTGRSKEVYKQLKINPNISICAINNGKWIRINATVVEDDRIDAQESMLDAYPDLKSMYRAGDGNTVVFYLTDVVATIYSFTDEPVVFKF